MKIIQYGAVIITKKDISVEGWLLEPEESDPVDATPEQMVLEVVIPWAQKRMNEAIMKNLRHNQALAQSNEALKSAGHVQYYGQAGTDPNPCVCVYCTKNPTEN